MNTTLTKTEYTEKQIDVIIDFVKRNQDRLTKQFGAKFIAVEYRDVRGGVVVDSDYYEFKLAKRVDSMKYGSLIVRTIEQFIDESERYDMFLD